uniref:Uncharacterized protein MANES_05G073700 n=1 Tax=Rhizophora mucronata TaxID=61149 RepID=A0A2P2JIS9_RHIMU
MKRKPIKTQPQRLTFAEFQRSRRVLSSDQVDSPISLACLPWQAKQGSP